jgi:putative flippase GtrA
MTLVKYISIQLIAYGIDLGLFLILQLSGFSGPIGSNILAKLAAGSFAFVAHRNFTFRVSIGSAIRQQAIRYFMLLAFNVLMASVILALLLVWITSSVAAKFIADIVCVALSYSLSKSFVFTAQKIP